MASSPPRKTDVRLPRPKAAVACIHVINGPSAEFASIALGISDATQKGTVTVSGSATLARYVRIISAATGSLCLGVE